MYQDKKLPYSAYILRVFNFTNFTNLESFAKFIQLKFQPLCCNTHGQHKFVKEFLQSSYSQNLDPRNISAIRYFAQIYTMLVSIHSYYYGNVTKFLAYEGMLCRCMEGDMQHYRVPAFSNLYTQHSVYACVEKYFYLSWENI